jgi:hypothetical protein
MSNTVDSNSGFSSVLDKIKELFFSPLTIFIVVLAFTTGYFFEWWMVAVAAFMGGLVFGKASGETFSKGMVAVAILWLFIVCYHHFSTEGILSNKIAQILPVGGNVGMLILVTVFIGGLVGGLGAMSGFFVRNLFKK